MPAGQKHWNGASPQTSTTHIAITEHLDSTGVQWMER
jgi:quercetin dioxygenase-like cupin family protein